MSSPARDWLPDLFDLCARVRLAARSAIAEGLERGSLAHLQRAVRAGAGDVTFGLDERTEEALDRWFDELARRAPLSLMTEDQGWRHRGPDGRGGWRELTGFDHGGPRVAVDPVDGTRNLMADLRSAWTIVSAAGPGAGEPRLSQLELGLAVEIPDSRGALARELIGLRAGGARYGLRRLADDSIVHERALEGDSDARPDHGYFPFFRYLAEQRPAIARVEAAFFRRLAEHEGADVSTCYDDQYISSGGQLALLALGVYRGVCDIRGRASRVLGLPALTSKPYDLAGAVLIAREAGCVVCAPDGGELDFQIDTHTPVDFAGFANPATHARLLPHLRAALGALGVEG